MDLLLSCFLVNDTHNLLLYDVGMLLKNKEQCCVFDLVLREIKSSGVPQMNLTLFFFFSLIQYPILVIRL